MTNIGNFFNLRNSHFRENVQDIKKEKKSRDQLILWSKQSRK